MRLMIIVTLLLLASCQKNTSTALDLAALKTIFLTNGSSFKTLERMIVQDSYQREKFEISEDRIGDYSLYEKGWAKKYGTYISVDDVLSENAISSSRYSEYLKLLSETGSSSIIKYENQISFIVSSAGFVFGGCLSSILRNPYSVSLERPEWAETFYKVQFENGWYGVTSCN